MTDQFLSKEQLADIQRRCDLATKGPWISSIEGRDHSSGESVIIRCDGKEDDLYIVGGSIADQDFIANARQDIPMLLAEIGKLHKVIDEIENESKSI